MHSEKWDKLNLFCPNCGKQGVWRKRETGDYYLGEDHVCIECDNEFYLPNNPSLAEGEKKASIDAIKLSLAESEKRNAVDMPPALRTATPQ